MKEFDQVRGISRSVACVRSGQRCKQNPSNVHDGTLDKSS